MVHKLSLGWGEGGRRGGGGKEGMDVGRYM